MSPPTRNTKGAHLSTRHRPSNLSTVASGLATDASGSANTPSIEGKKELAVQTEYYTLIGVAQDCSDAELRAAYKKRALEEHPDKGGDQDRFDELQHAFSVLSDEARRDAYDVELSKFRSQVRVEGRPENRKVPVERATADKTAPHIGSKRSKDWIRCAAEHNAERSGAAMVEHIKLAITDAADTAVEGGGYPVQKDPKELEKEQTEALFQKFKTLNDGMKKQWVATLTGKQKQALKARSKAEEAKEMQKAKQWLTKR